MSARLVTALALLSVAAPRAETEDMRYFRHGLLGYVWEAWQ